MRPMMNRDDLTPIEKYIPPRHECLKEYEIRIKFLDVGCIVGVGCREIAFSNIDDAITELNKYFKDPYNIKEEWYETFKNQN
jgi:hypothetical protein